jgi:UDP-4-amino-4-deoxy-L-arabinose formyltransferase/UDP-glucuronic acid dehydrogenase (UDP-4-keto-hexauronic acid decarboxylating)
MRVAAFGRTQWLYDSARACASSGHHIVLIGTCPAMAEYTVTEADFAKLAQEFRAAYFCDVAINQPEYVKMAKESRAEVAISVNWLTLIGQEMLDQFEYGVINAHAGDLPRFRGNACPNWAILAGEEQVVLTLHRMVVDLDAGPILLQRAFRLSPDTYIADVYRFMAKTIPEMFVEVLDGLTTGSIIPIEQPSDLTLSLRCFPRVPQDQEVEWNRPAVELSRLVRASAEPFGGAYSFIDHEKVILWRAHPERLPYPCLGVPGQVAEIRPQTGEVTILTGDGVLVLEEIETGSDGRGRASDLIRSTRIRFGLHTAQEIVRLEERMAQLEMRLQEILEKQSAE